MQWFFLLFSRSYITQYGRLLTSYLCRLQFCLSVCLWCWALWICNRSFSKSVQTRE